MIVRALVVVALLSACSRDPSSSPRSGDDTKPPGGKPLAHIAGDNFKVDTASACAGGECTATIRLEATGEYHLNEAYPYRFKASPADGVVFEGSDSSGPNVFTKANGDFAKQTEKVGVMTMKVRPARATTIIGTFKMSVCSAANCQLEQPDVAIDVAP